MSEHTKEPWRTDAASGFPGDVMAGESMVARVITCLGREESTANARRIVACVNACKGLDTVVLETFPGVMEPVLYFHEVRKQRDELLGLVERYRNETPVGHQPHMIALLADAAIARAKGA